MTDVFRIPRLRVPAQVTLLGRQVRHVQLFLGERAESHSGHERPSDVLESGIDFLPALDRDEVVFLNLKAVEVLSLPAHVEFGAEEMTVLDAALLQSTHRRVEVELADGTSVRGDVTYIMPEGQRRLQDFLNDKGRFLRLRDGETARLIHKRHILMVRQG
jgi:hypothetical protein